MRLGTCSTQDERETSHRCMQLSCPNRSITIDKEVYLSNFRQDVLEIQWKWVFKVRRVHYFKRTGVSIEHWRSNRRENVTDIERNLAQGKIKEIASRWVLFGGRSRKMRLLRSSNQPWTWKVYATFCSPDLYAIPYLSPLRKNCCSQTKIYPLSSDFWYLVWRHFVNLESFKKTKNGSTKKLF
jgi:hypothetical protein